MFNPLARMRYARINIRTNKRIRVPLLIQIGQRMINLPMLRLVRANIQQQISHTPLSLRHIPVLDSDIRRLEFLPFRELAGLEVADGEGVGEDGFFFEDADEAVHGSGGEQVGDEEGVEEDALRAEAHEAHEPAGFGELEEGEEVHAFVVGFF